MAYQNYDLPELYRGKNLFLRDTLDGYIMQDNEWYTTIALPWIVTDQQHIKFNKFEFNRMLVGKVPHEGISRNITTSKSQFSGHTERHGVGFVMEGDLAGTPQGDVQYMRNIMGISQSCQETANHDVLYELLRCKDYKKEFNALYRLYGQSIDRVRDREVNQFACVAADPDCLDVIVEEYKKLLTGRRVAADLLILWPGAQIYMTMVSHGTRTKYWQYGPDGVANLLDGPEAMAKFRGLAVFETRGFDVEAPEPAVQLLQRDVAVGEVYPLTFGANRGRDNYSYRSAHRDVYMYDITQDAYGKVTFKRALCETNLFDGNEPHPEIERMANELNAKFANSSESFANRAARYGQGAPSLDCLDGESESTRDTFFMLAHDTERKQVFVPAYFGQFDFDAINSSDFQQMAESMLGHAFGVGGVPDSFLSVYADGMALVRDIEAEPYNDKFFEDVIAANIAYSANKNDIFVGEPDAQNIVNDWKPNKHGGLRLPAYQKDQSGAPNLPPGYANWPGLKTLADEANNANSYWQAAGKRAKLFVDVFENFTSRLEERAQSALLLGLKAKPDWFHKESSALSLFTSGAHTERDPIWLGALPITSRDLGEPDDVPEAAATTTVAQWAPAVRTWVDKLEKSEVVPATVAVFTGSLPAGLYWAYFLADTDAGEKVSKTLVKFLEKVATSTARGPTAVAQREKVRSDVIDTIQGYMAHASKDAMSTLRSNAVAAVKTNLAIDGDAQLTLEAAKEKVKALGVSLSDGKGANTAAVRAYKKLSDDERTKRDEANAAAAKRLNSKTALTNISVPSAPPVPVLPTSANYEKAVKALPLDETSRAVDRMQAMLRAHATVPGFKWQAPRAWLSALRQHGVSGAELSDVEKAINVYTTAIATLEAKMVETGIATASAKSASSFLGAGASVNAGAGAKQALNYFRSPLTMTLELFKTISSEKNPLIRPSEPAAAHATYFNPWANSTDAATSNEMTRRVWERHAYAEVGANGSLPAKSKPMHLASFMSQHRLAPRVLNKEAVHAFNVKTGKREAGGSLEPTTYSTDVHFSALTEEERTGLPSWDSEATKFERSVIAARAEPYGAHRDIDAELADRFRDEQARARAAALAEADRRGAEAMSSARSGVSDAQEGGFQPLRSLLGYEKAQSGAAHRFTEASATRTAAQPLFAGSTYDMPIGADADEDARYNKPKVEMPKSTRRIYDGSNVLGVNGEHDAIMRGAFASRWAKAQAIVNPAVRLAVSVALTLPNTRATWTALVDKDVHVPVNIILWRLWIENSMYTAIMMKSGYETGASFYGSSNFAIGSDVTSKMLLGNFTYYSKAMVYTEKNVIHLNNIKPSAHRGGWNLRFIKSKDEIDGNTLPENRGSLIATAMEITANRFQTPISFVRTDTYNTSRHPSMAPAAEAAANALPNKAHSSADYYAKFWGINPAPYTYMHEQNYFDLEKPPNVVAYRGKHFLYNRQSKMYNRFVAGNGHLSGARTGPGARAVWNNQMKKFPEQRDQEQILT